MYSVKIVFFGFGRVEAIVCGVGVETYHVGDTRAWWIDHTPHVIQRWAGAV